MARVLARRFSMPPTPRQAAIHMRAFCLSSVVTASISRSTAFTILPAAYASRWKESRPFTNFPLFNQATLDVGSLITCRRRVRFLKHLCDCAQSESERSARLAPHGPRRHHSKTEISDCPITSSNVFLLPHRHSTCTLQRFFKRVKGVRLGQNHVGQR